MANFCTKCGKKLDKDERCTCEKIKKETTTVNDEKDVSILIKQFINAPIDTLSNLTEYKENNYLLALLSSLSFGVIGVLECHIFCLSKLITTSLLVFISLMIFAYVISMIENLIYKKESNFDNTLTIVSTSSIILLVTNVITCLLSFISISLSEITLIIGMILFTLYLYHGLSLNSNVDKNKIGYLLITSIIVTMLIMSFMLNLFIF